MFSGDKLQSIMLFPECSYQVGQLDPVFHIGFKINPVYMVLHGLK